MVVRARALATATLESFGWLLAFLIADRHDPRETLFPALELEWGTKSMQSSAYDGVLTRTTAMNKARIGSTLESFLEETGIKKDVDRLARKKLLNTRNGKARASRTAGKPATRGRR